MISFGFVFLFRLFVCYYPRGYGELGQNFKLVST